MIPKPHEWWLRPVMSAARVGEHVLVDQRMRLRVGIELAREDVSVMVAIAADQHQVVGNFTADAAVVQVM